MSFQRIKGGDDRYPADQAVRRAIAVILADQAEKYGFQEVDSPAMEHLDLLTAKSGDEIKEQLFLLEKKGAEALGLRFDLTVPMTRMFVAKQREMQKPVKWYSLSKMWRYEAPQKGRLREFMQLSVELFGAEYPESDAQCINLLIACMKALGLRKEDIVIKINNRKLLEGLLTDVVSQEKLPDVVRIIDKSAKITQIAFVESLQKLGLDMQNIEVIKKIIACKGDASILQSLREKLNPNALALEGLEELQNTLTYVDTNFIQVDLSIARGLVYYTGNVYECFDTDGKFRSLAGGGRYDQLVQLLGGEASPATGFAIGLETLSLVLAEKNMLPQVQTGPDYYIAPITPEMLPKALEIASELRKKATVDVDLMRRKLTKQLDYADFIGAQNVVIVGEKDIAQGQVTVRNLKTGKEEKISLRDL